MLRKTSLFIVGAPKCGTTAWYEYLRHHPDVFFPNQKEPGFFCTDLPNWGRISDFAAYNKLYQNSISTVLGDATPFYLYSKLAATEIYNFNPSSKIIILVRDQDEFFDSVHNQFLFSGVECIEDPREAWSLSGKRNKSNMVEGFDEPKILDYKSLGRFSEQIGRYFSVFPREQIRIFHMRQWTANPRETYLEILDLLGLSDDGRVAFGRVNEAHRHRYDWAADFVRNPPPIIARAVNLLRRASGRQGLGLGELFFRLNTRTGRITRSDSALHSEIREYYREENEQLRQILRMRG